MPAPPLAEIDPDPASVPTVYGPATADTDPRMGPEAALAAFDASWAWASRTGVELSETETGTLYVRCLEKIMTGEGMEAGAEILPRSEKVQKILREVFP